MFQASVSERKGAARDPQSPGVTRANTGAGFRTSMSPQVPSGPRAQTMPDTNRAKPAAQWFLTPLRSGILQRKCACGGAVGMEDQCEECKQTSGAVLRRHATGNNVSSTEPPAALPARRM